MDPIIVLCLSKDNILNLPLFRTFTDEDARAAPVLLAAAEPGEPAAAGLRLLHATAAARPGGGAGLSQPGRGGRARGGDSTQGAQGHCRQHRPAFFPLQQRGVRSGQ